MKLLPRRYIGLLAVFAALLCFLFAVSLPTWAEAPKPAQSAAAAKLSAGPRPALWKIADKDTTIYLFGTIHVLPQGIDWFRGRVAEAFAQSDSLVTEVVGQGDADMQGLVIKLATQPEGVALRDGLSPEQRSAYEAALAKLNIQPAALDPFEPWYVALTLSSLPLMREGFSPEHGVEQALTQRAQARKLAHTGLETVEYQLSLFDGLSAPAQNRYLGEVVDQLPKLKEQIGQMIAAWEAGDAEALAELMNAAESDPDFMERMLTDRNREWAKWLDQRLDQPGTVFVAVGAGHLAGNGSVQKYLRARGIRTKRVQ